MGIAVKSLYGSRREGVLTAIAASGYKDSSKGFVGDGKYEIHVVIGIDEHRFPVETIEGLRLGMRVVMKIDVWEE